MSPTERANLLAVKLLLRQQIRSVRTDPFHLDCSGTILVDSIQHYAHCVGAQPEDFLAQNSRDCVVLQMPRLHLILYNRDILSSSRKRWSVAHEIGHICCRHDCDRPAQEMQANAFASSLLIPSVVAREFLQKGYLRRAEDLCALFGVSMQAAQYKFPLLLDYQPSQLEQELLLRYRPAIEEQLHGPIIDLPYHRSFEHSPLLL